jgi:hypothetical protein
MIYKLFLQLITAPYNFFYVGDMFYMIATNRYKNQQFFSMGVKTLENGQWHK